MVTLSPLCKFKFVALDDDKSICMQNEPSRFSWKKGVIWVKLSKEVGLDALEMSTAAKIKK